MGEARLSFPNSTVSKQLSKAPFIFSGIPATPSPCSGEPRARACCQAAAQDRFSEVFALQHHGRRTSLELVGELLQFPKHTRDKSNDRGSEDCKCQVTACLILSVSYFLQKWQHYFTWVRWSERAHANQNQSKNIFLLCKN